MKNQENKGLNLFIVDDDHLMLADLRIYLQARFGPGLSITTFESGEKCLERVDSDTHIVILDYFLNGKNGVDILKAIKGINPNTEVVMFSNNEDVAVAIETFRSGAKDYVIKGAGSRKKLAQHIINLITRPFKIIVKGFSR